MNFVLQSCGIRSNEDIFATFFLSKMADNPPITKRVDHLATEEIIRIGSPFVITCLRR
jgi:hypothetical protein